MAIDFFGFARAAAAVARHSVVRSPRRNSYALGSAPRQAPCALLMPACGFLLTACGPAYAVLVPQLSLSSTLLIARNDSTRADQNRAELVLGLSAIFQPRPLRALLPSVFDMSPDLAALPCDEDDSTCLSEAQPADAKTQRWLSELQ